MKLTKKSCIISVILMSFILVGSTLALDPNSEQYFDITAKGPISVRVGDFLDLTLTAENTDVLPHFIKEVTITVIDPFNGIRILGPQSIQINASIEGLAQASGTISLGPFDASHQDLTAAAIILVVGNNDEINGYGGWGFVIE
jgi:hypothetical protein